MRFSIKPHVRNGRLPLGIAILLFALGSVLAQEQSAPAKYELHPGDEVEVQLTYNPEFSERVQIRPDGFVSLPLLGEVHMAGETVEALSQRLQKAYAPHLVQPQLTIQVRSYADRKIFVGGEVGRPGMLPLVNTKTVLEAIIEAGGMKESAKKGMVTVIRRTPKGEPAQFLVALSAKSQSTPTAAAFQLEPLDVVVVAESGISKANRGIDQYIRRMMPILMTGGFTYLFGPTTGFPGR